MKYDKMIKKLELFEGVHPETINNILKMSQVIEYPKGTLLMGIREKVDFIYIQLTGKTIEYNLTYNGRRKILFVLGTGNMMNEYFFNRVPSTVYCETLEKSRMLVIKADDFIQLMQNDFELTKNVISIQERKICRLKHQLRNTSSDMPVEKGMLSKFLKLARDFGIDNEYGREIDMDLSVTFLADMLGVPRETASRACSKLISLGFIRKENKRITVINENDNIMSYLTNKNK